MCLADGKIGTDISKERQIRWIRYIVKLAQPQTKHNKLLWAIMEISVGAEAYAAAIQETAEAMEGVRSIATDVSSRAEEMQAAKEEQAYSIEQTNVLASELKGRSEELYEVVRQFDTSR